MVIIKCCKCNKEKPETEFAVFHGRRNRSCKDCRGYHNTFYKENKDGYKDKRRQYYIDNKKAHRERAYKNHLKRKYGLSLEQLTAMLATQKNKCLICGALFRKTDKWDSPCVDHEHTTGKVRGVLCRGCNISLYWLESGMAAKAEKYLSRFKEVGNKESPR